MSANNWPSNQPDWQERFAESDKAAGIEITEDFEPFVQRNDVFSRAFWDDNVSSKKTLEFFKSYRVGFKPRKGAGFSRKDLALRNASWSVSDLFSNRANAEGKREGFQSLVEVDSPVARDKVEVEDKAEFTTEVKAAAKLFGADLFGVTEIDERWHYQSRVDVRDFSETETDLPEGMTSVIVMAHAMDYELVKTYPSALAGAATGAEYSHEAAIVTQMVTFLRQLGFEAHGSMNDTALVIPYAVKAGLGEYARNQLVITKEFGPRVRFSKIFTTAPLLHSKPSRPGVQKFCDICTKCADACPVKALPYGPPKAEQVDQSTIKGVKKWTADCVKCFGFWAAMASDCAICMRVCPFNRPYDSWKDRLFLKVAFSRFRKLALWWDNKSKRADRAKPEGWWKN
jgi:epoxyqueuosine reductase